MDFLGKSNVCPVSLDNHFFYVLHQFYFVFGKFLTHLYGNGNGLGTPITFYEC